jgi:hypothetical protein
VADKPSEQAESYLNQVRTVYRLSVHSVRAGSIMENLADSRTGKDRKNLFANAKVINIYASY